MNKELLNKLTDLLTSVQIIAPGVITNRDEVVRNEPFYFQFQERAETIRSAAATADEERFLNVLRDFLYVSYYCPGFRRETLSRSRIEPIDLTEEFVKANQSRSRLESGWRIWQILAPDRFIAYKEDRFKIVAAGDFLNSGGSGVPLLRETPIDIFFPAGSGALQPAFYFVFGERTADSQDEYQLLRIYFNIENSGAASLVETVSANFNRRQIPFHFKCLKNAQQYERSDAAVLYISKRYWHIARLTLIDIQRIIKSYLREETPLFTKRLAPGIAIAEDPGDGNSFGLHRCRLLAESLWISYLNGEFTAPVRLTRLKSYFRRCGLDLSKPYLNAFSFEPANLSFEEEK